MLMILDIDLDFEILDSVLNERVQMYVYLNYQQKLIKPINIQIRILKSICFLWQIFTSWGMSVLLKDVGFLLLTAHWQEGNWQFFFVQGLSIQITEVNISRKSNENINWKKFI